MTSTEQKGPTEPTEITSEELQKVYNLSYLRLPKKGEDLAKVTSSLSSMTSWLSEFTHVSVPTDTPRMFTPLPL